MSPKDVILARITNAKVKSATYDRPPVNASERTREEIVEQFAEYVAEYKANVVRSSAETLPSVIADLLKGERALIAQDFPAKWTPPNAVIDHNLSTQELDQPEAVLTLSAVGIAETGTIVLDAGLGQGRRAISLVPDHHVLLVPIERIVDSVPEAVAVLAEAVRAGRPLTWISGPSATSDIELSRVEGVHGPRRLDVIIVGPH